MKRINKASVLALSAVIAVTLAIAAILAQSPNGQAARKKRARAKAGSACTAGFTVVGCGALCSAR